MPAKKSPAKKPEKASRVTLRMIAGEARLSLTATSMALRNHPDIAAKTRARIQALARKLGYHPDPKLATLMQHLRMKSGAVYLETIAYLSTYASYEEWRVYSQHDYYLGAVERAAELGYRVELFHLGELGMTPARMSNLLQARGIRGIFIGSFVQSGAQLNLAWDRFAAVTFAYSLVSPVLHRITTDYYREMRSVLQRLQNEGCLRIGLNLSTDDDVKVHSLWRSAYLLFQDGLPKARRIPMNASLEGKQNLAAWTDKYQPDAIISAGCDFPAAYEQIHGRPAPTTIRYVNMNIHHADARSQGIDQDSWEVGRLACGHLVTMLQRNETGLPERPQVITIEGRWVDDYDGWQHVFDSRRTRPRNVHTLPSNSE